MDARLGCEMRMGGIEYKPWTVATPSRTLYDALVPYRCLRDHVREVLEDKETANRRNSQRRLQVWFTHIFRGGKCAE